VTGFLKHWKCFIPRREIRSISCRGPIVFTYVLFWVRKTLDTFKNTGDDRPFFPWNCFIWWDGWTDGRMGRSTKVSLNFLYIWWVDGWVDGCGGISKVSFKFLDTLWVYRQCIYLYIYINVQSLSPTLLWVWKFDVKLESLNFIFKTLIREMCFWKIMIKVRCFKTPLVPRFFWIYFSDLSKILISSDHSPLEVSTKPLHLPPGSSAGFTPRARSASLMGGLVGWLVDGVSKVSFKFLYTLWVYR